ncbi:alpha/beta fold hydrolase [Taibaiella soli]|uniref:AB hydrolase-1 domain-containing protein n=1 Tax=Taibaiella soli TaxID=1649169 RepID=A0A2W2APF9_9BACT|nr:alpha/beta hydrolase [Taibaiella soli]PZF74280.1 hypothetical protein DN068_04535 [Taibaiella soli]
MPEISFNNRKLHYLQMGSGPEWLIAFHGYGNNASIFKDLAAELGERYTVLSFDLPFHGGSSGWPDDSAFLKDDLVALMKSIQALTGAESFSLMGYSMGGRVCLCVAELMPEIIKQILLIAPDGLVFNSFYYFVTHVAAGRYLFRKFLTSQSIYAPVINGLRKLHLLDISRYRFVMHYLESEQSRHMLLKVWPAMRMLIPDHKKLKENISRDSIPIHIFMGQFDRVIPVKLARQFSKDLPTVHLHVLAKGHKLLDGRSNTEIASVLL